MRRSLVSTSSIFAAFTWFSYASVASAQEATKPAVVVADTGHDHDDVVGHFAVGYFGISSIPVFPSTTGGLGTNSTNVTAASISAPIIGARYWISQKLGIDAGVGFSGTKDGWGVAVHGGVPLALATSRHMTFELIPEATIAFAGNNSASNVSESGFLLDVGARIGGEIQFGFIGIPQLALQASVGVYLQHTSIGISVPNETVPNSNTTSFATSVQSDPWGIFTDNISALYYF